MDVLAILVNMGTRRPSTSSKTSRAFESNLRGRVLAEEFTASRAKNQFAHALESAITKGAVVITKHNSAKAVLLPIEEFDDLTREREERMSSLRAEFDALYSRMQEPSFGRGLDALFTATPEEFGRAYVKLARGKKKRGG